MGRVFPSTVIQEQETGVGSGWSPSSQPLELGHLEISRPSSLWALELELLPRQSLHPPQSQHTREKWHLWGERNCSVLGFSDHRGCGPQCPNGNKGRSTCWWACGHTCLGASGTEQNSGRRKHLFCCPLSLLADFGGPKDPIRSRQRSVSPSCPSRARAQRGGDPSGPSTVTSPEVLHHWK